MGINEPIYQYRHKRQQKQQLNQTMHILEVNETEPQIESSTIPASQWALKQSIQQLKQTIDFHVSNPDARQILHRYLEELQKSQPTSETLSTVFHRIPSSSTEHELSLCRQCITDILQITNKVLMGGGAHLVLATINQLHPNASWTSGIQAKASAQFGLGILLSIFAAQTLDTSLPAIQKSISKIRQSHSSSSDRIILALNIIGQILRSTAASIVVPGAFCSAISAFMTVSGQISNHDHAEKNAAQRLGQFGTGTILTAQSLVMSHTLMAAGRNLGQLWGHKQFLSATNDHANIDQSNCNLLSSMRHKTHQGSIHILTELIRNGCLGLGQGLLIGATVTHIQSSEEDDNTLNIMAMAATGLSLTAIGVILNIALASGKSLFSRTAQTVNSNNITSYFRSLSAYFRTQTNNELRASTQNYVASASHEEISILNAQAQTATEQLQTEMAELSAQTGSYHSSELDSLTSLEGMEQTGRTLLTTAYSWAEEQAQIVAEVTTNAAVTSYPWDLNKIRYIDDSDSDPSTDNGS